jgi:hypothetical protein
MISNKKREYNRQYYLKNKSKLRKQNKEYREKNKDRLSAIKYAPKARSAHA